MGPGWIESRDRTLARIQVCIYLLEVNYGHGATYLMQITAGYWQESGLILGIGLIKGTTRTIQSIIRSSSVSGCAAAQNKIELPKETSWKTFASNYGIGLHTKLTRKFLGFLVLHCHLPVATWAFSFFLACSYTHTYRNIHVHIYCWVSIW